MHRSSGSSAVGYRVETVLFHAALAFRKHALRLLSAWQVQLRNSRAALAADRRVWLLERRQTELAALTKTQIVSSSDTEPSTLPPQSGGQRAGELVLSSLSVSRTHSVLTCVSCDFETLFGAIVGACVCFSVLELVFELELGAAFIFVGVCLHWCM